jgi:hypothetical protein
MVATIASVAESIRETVPLNSLVAQTASAPNSMSQRLGPTGIRGHDLARLRIDPLDASGAVAVHPERARTNDDAAGLRTHLDAAGDAVGGRIDTRDRRVAEVADPEGTKPTVLGAARLARGDPGDNASRLQRCGRRRRSDHHGDQNGWPGNVSRHVCVSQ